MIVELYVFFILHLPGNRPDIQTKASFIELQTVDQCEEKLATLKGMFRDSTTDIVGKCITWEDKK